MSRAVAVNSSTPHWPRLWRLAIVALGTLILCSCRGPRPVASHPGPAPTAGSPGGGTWGLPEEAYRGSPAGAACPDSVPLPSHSAGPWTPPGIARPWPADEYLQDGGDRGVPAQVAPDWMVSGLEPEDTIAHYDTVDGRTVVEASNRVTIYSPRFASVRQVVGLRQNFQRKHLAGVDLPVKLVQHEDRQSAEFRQQHIQPNRQIGTDHLMGYRSRKRGDRISSALHPEGFHDERVKAWETVTDLPAEHLDGSQMAWLAQAVQAAVAWSHDLGVQVILDNQAATAHVASESVGITYTVREPPFSPQLQIIKGASQPSARPGETVDFTIRFENVGDQIIGNVTIIDNLTTRLEFVPGSEQCSIQEHRFSTQVSEGDSLVLRWEITNPLEPGQHGVIRFTCRVR